MEPLLKELQFIRNKYNEVLAEMKRRDHELAEFKKLTWKKLRAYEIIKEA